MGNHVESDGFGEWAALSASNDVTFLYGEGRGAVNSDVLVPLLVTTVLRDVVQVIPSDNDSSLHLGGNDQTRQDSSTNRNITCEGALFVYIVSFNGSIWCLDTKTDVLDKTHGLLASVANGTLTGDKDAILLLISLLVLCSRSEGESVTVLEPGIPMKYVVLSVQRYLRSHSTYSLGMRAILLFSENSIRVLT